MSDIPSRQYEAICKDKFEDLQEKIDEIHPKIINGLSGLPNQIRWFVGIGVLVLISAFGVVFLRIDRVEDAVHRVENLIIDQVIEGEDDR